MHRAVTATFILAMMLLPSNVYSSKADDVDDAIDTIENTIQELQDAQDSLEQYRSNIDDDDSPNESTLKAARRTMRDEAVALLLGSVDVRKRGDLDCVMASIRALGYNLEPGRSKIHSKRRQPNGRY